MECDGADDDEKLPDMGILLEEMMEGATEAVDGAGEVDGATAEISPDVGAEGALGLEDVLAAGDDECGAIADEIVDELASAGEGAAAPAEVAPAVALSAKYFLVFSSVTSITDFLCPLRPSSRALFVSCQRPFNSSDIVFLLI